MQMRELKYALDAGMLIMALLHFRGGTMKRWSAGTREALESIGVDPDEQEQILAAIHRSGWR